MAWLSSTIVALCLLSCSCRRILTQSSVRMTADPEWCLSQVDPKHCNAMQQIVCKETCSGVVSQDEVATAERPQKQMIQLEVVDEDMSPTALIKVRRSDLYKRAWPANCEGKNEFGDFIMGLSTDRFLCNPQDGRVHEINSPGYRGSRPFSCCQNECKSEKACDQKTYTFAEAAKVALSLAALKADHVVTENGHNVKIEVKKYAADVVTSTGVHAAVEVRMPDSDLKFEVALAKLTAKGEDFLVDLAGSLGPLISMQISAYDSLSKVVICTHAESSQTFESLKGGPHEMLPKERADAVRNVLAEVVPAEVASLGDGIAHYNKEVDGYQSDRRAFIIYKLYDPNFPAPVCEKQDLYMFLPEVAAAGK